MRCRHTLHFDPLFNGKLYIFPNYRGQGETITVFSNTENVAGHHLLTAISCVAC